VDIPVRSDIGPGFMGGTLGHLGLAADKNVRAPMVLPRCAPCIGDCRDGAKKLCSDAKNICQRLTFKKNFEKVTAGVLAFNKAFFRGNDAVFRFCPPKALCRRGFGTFPAKEFAAIPVGNYGPAFSILGMTST
jgi:hypothetical protein